MIHEDKSLEFIQLNSLIAQLTHTLLS